MPNHSSDRLRIGFISDVHLHNHSKFGGPLSSGINRRCRAILDSLERLIDIAHEKKIDSLVIAGDLFDVANPTPQIVAALLAVMRRFRGSWVVVEGNHDMRSMQIGDHALGPLRFGERIYVAERAGVIRDTEKDQPLIYAVPFRPGPSDEWFPKDFPTGMLVAIHLGVIGDDTPEYLRKSDDAIAAERLFELMEEFQIPAVFAGNWHSHRVWEGGGGTVVQMGAFAPKTIAESGPEFGKLAIYDSSGVEIVTVPGPRFVRAKTIDEFDSALEELAESGTDVFVEYEHSDPDEKLSDVYTRLDSAMKAQKIADYKVLPASSSQSEIDETVAAAIVASSSFEQAVDEFVQGLGAQSFGGRNSEDGKLRATNAIRNYLAGRSAIEEKRGDT